MENAMRTILEDLNKIFHQLKTPLINLTMLDKETKMFIKKIYPYLAFFTSPTLFMIAFIHQFSLLYTIAQIAFIYHFVWLKTVK